MLPQSDVSGIRYLPVRNSESETIPAFGVMQVESLEVSGDQLVFVVGKPDGTGKPILFNSYLPIAASGKGSGTADFPAPGLFDDADGAPAAGTNYGPVSGSWKLKKNNAGFQAMGAELANIADVTLFLSALGGVQIGKTDASHAKGATGTISVYSDASTDTTQNITATNLFADLESGKWVAFVRIGGIYYLIAGEC
jgi:hypothetical protein